MAVFKYPKVSNTSLRALAYEIKNQISGGITTDDSVYSIRLIESEIKHQAGLAQKEEDLANEILGILPNAQRVVTYPCIPLTDTNDFYCKCTQSGGKFKKAVLPVKLLQWRGQSYINYLGNTDMDMSFTPMINISEINATDGMIKKPTYFLSGNAIYVRLPKDMALMCEITVLAIPDSTTDSNGLCFDVWSQEWTIPEYMKAIVKARVLQALVPTMVATNQGRDIRNNAQDGNQFATTLTP